VKRGLSLRDVSRATGLDVARLARIERGERYPPFGWQLLLAQAFDVAVPELFDNAQPTPPDSAEQDSSEGAVVLGLSERRSGRRRRLARYVRRRRLELFLVGSAIMAAVAIGLTISLFPN